MAGFIQVFIHTNRFNKYQSQHFGSLTVRLPRPRAHTPTMIKHVLRALEQMLKPGYHYQKAGIILTDLTSQDSVQLDLFGATCSEREEPLVGTLN